MLDKEILSFLASALTIIAFFPYILSILKNETRPHVFSWVIWAITTLVVFAAQLSDKGGVGAWPTGLSGVITAGIALLAYFHPSELKITYSDWIFFIIALLTIPFWYTTSNPMGAVIILTIVDLLGFIPTIRKSYEDPYHENLGMYWIVLLRNILGIFALEHYSVTTVLFPAAMSIGILILIPIIWGRRIQNQSKL